MAYLFTSESVSEGHPDKVADQISDAVLDAMLAQDPHSRVACETLCTTGLVVVAGEIRSKAYVEVQDIVRQTILGIGYNKSDYMFDGNSCGILVALHEQSPDIAMGVDENAAKDLGAGDQGMMFGYATRETPEFMPMSLAFSHRLVHELANLRRAGELMPYLRPDAKSQVTIQYDSAGRPHRVHTIVVSTQHDDFHANEQVMLEKIRADVRTLLIPRVIPAEMIDADTIIHVNPTGKFVIGGPHGDTGLTGRKIIVDTYGGKGAHGGGAFSGKDPSKVDRSAAYAARHVAKNLVAAGVADECLVQVAYAIGVSHPVSVNVNTYGTGKVKLTDAQIALKVAELFDLRPAAIIERLGLRLPIFQATAAYGHMGRPYETREVAVNYVSQHRDGDTWVETKRPDRVAARFFAWEALDYVEPLREAFGL
ncbi:MAG: methionine adenosyltransferase [Bacteroidia bacterium]|nr:methionine adenosyltransferase [Bacteroidia bacterium]